MDKVILIVGPSHKRLGGISQFIISLREISFHEGYDFKLLDTTANGNSIIINVIYKVAHICRTIYKLWATKFWLVHIHTSSYLGFYEKMMLLVIAKLFNQKTIFHIHGGEFVSFYRGTKHQKLIRKVLSFSDLVLFVDSEAMKIVGLRNCQFLANFTSIPHLEHNAVRVSDIPHFVTVSVLEERKKIDLIIRASSVLLRSGFVFRLSIAGDGPQADTLRSLVSSLDLEKVVSFTGPVRGNEKEALFRSADTFILASTSESFAITIIEAMSFSLDIIATNVGIVPFVNSEIGTISIIEIDNLTSLVSAMRAKLEDEDIGAIDKRRESNRAMCISHFSDNKFSLEIESIYKKIGLDS